MISVLPFLLFAGTGGAATKPEVAPSKITEVSIYGSSALVHRGVDLPMLAAGEERTIVIEGLTNSLDRDNLRVTCEGGDVVSVEVKDRYAKSPPDERVAGLRETLRGLVRQRAGLSDDNQVIEAMGRHLDRLLRQEEEAHNREVGAGRPNPEAWAANMEFIAERLIENRRLARAKGWEIEGVDQLIRDLELELGRMQGTSGVHVFDVELVVVAHGEEELSLGLDYVVGRAGWRPQYDLRAAKDARSVELVYRAQVWQQTGEDWTDVQVLLSTARPRRGAQGPEPRPAWVDIVQPVPEASVAFGGGRAGERGLATLGYAAESAEDSNAEARNKEGLMNLGLNRKAKRPFAVMEDEGLSARFRLARRETIESRDQPTTVLVGRATLGAEPEHVCVPAIDTTVWLRGLTTNDSSWTLLPGRAAVFFGADFLGHATLEAVQPGEEFTLHLGAVPGLTVERTQIANLRKGPGFFGSKESLVDGYRIHIENHGAAASADDGSVSVIVREVLPRPTDDRLDVDLTEASPQPSTDERWKQDTDEKGIQTWVVSVAADGEADIVYEVRIAYPRGETIRVR